MTKQSSPDLIAMPTLEKSSSHRASTSRQERTRNLIAHATNLLGLASSLLEQARALELPAIRHLSFAATIEPGRVLAIVQKPQGRFAPIGFVVANPDHFKILDVKIGNTSQFLNDVNLPGSAFTPAFACRWHECLPGMEIRVEVENTSRNTLAFEATMAGETEF